jgi:integrase
MSVNRRRRGEGCVFRRGSIWWVNYSVNGNRVQESSKSTREADAVRLLRRRLGELGTGTFVGPDAEKVTFEDMTARLVANYEFNKRKSTRRMREAVANLAQYFAGRRALQITTATLTDYQHWRVEKAALATAAYELACLKRAFTLAVDQGLIPRAPKFPTLTVSNARQGFFEAAEFGKVVAELPDYFAPVARFGYYTGWRLGEIVGLTWDRVDFAAGVIRLDVRGTKNDDGRVLPVDALPALLDLLKRQRGYTDVIETVEGHVVPFVFHRGGKQLKDNYTAWRAACKRAGLAGRLFHDFRRTAVRNLERAGVSRSVAMRITGHRTEAVYRRYAIVNEADIREGVAKLASALFHR